MIDINELRHRLALESQENGALRDSVDRACEERDELRTELKEVRHGVAVAHDVINTLRARIEAAEKKVAHIEGRNIYSVNAITDSEGFTYQPLIANVEDDGINCWDANARLIAAAPDLLEALQELCDIVEDAIAQKSAKDLDSFTLQPARAAIARATGDQL